MQSVATQPPSSTLKAEWDSITVEYSQAPPGENNFSFSSNVISVVLQDLDIDPQGASLYPKVIFS